MGHVGHADGSVITQFRTRRRMVGTHRDAVGTHLGRDRFVRRDVGTHLGRTWDAVGTHPAPLAPLPYKGRAGDASGDAVGRRGRE